jgi:exopolysaccharide production protein ExoQ
MPPNVALSLYFILLIILFSIEFKKETEVSHAIWIPLLWFIVAGTKPVVQWIYPGLTHTMHVVESVEAGNQIDQIYFLALLITGIIILSRRGKQWSELLKKNKWILVLFLYCALSLLWSDFPFSSLKRFVRSIGTLLMVLIILTEKDPIEAMKTVVIRCAYISIPLSIVFIKYFRHIGVRYSYWSGEVMNTGVAGDKNTLGRLCLVCGLFLFFAVFDNWKNRRRIDFFSKMQFYANIFVFSMVCFLLYKAKSTTSTTCLIIGIGAFLLIGLPFVKKNVRNFGLFMFFGILILLILQYLFNIVEISVGLTGKDMTFTGRVDLWAELLDFGTNPLIGVGYDSFWLGKRLQHFWDLHWWKPSQAHNGMLEVYINLGLIGVFLWIAVLVRFYFLILRNIKIHFGFGRFQLVFLLIFILYNITESAIHLQSFLVFNLFLITLCPVTNCYNDQ